MNLKKFILAILWIIAIGVISFFLLIWYMGINAIPPGGE